MDATRSRKRTQGNRLRFRTSARTGRSSSLTGESISGGRAWALGIGPYPTPLRAMGYHGLMSARAPEASFMDAVVNPVHAFLTFVGETTLLLWDALKRMWSRPF